MQRIDLYITDEQKRTLDKLYTEGINKSFLLRRALDMYIDSDDFNAIIECLKEKK